MAMRHFLHNIPYSGKDTRVVQEPDPLIVGTTQRVIERGEHILGKSLHPDARRAAGK